MMRTKFFIATVLALSLPVVSGCSDQGNERLSEKATIEGKASSEAQIQTENQNRQQKASEMEADLVVRHRFYQAARGTYEGDLETEQGAFKVKLTLIPSLPPYAVSRTRQLDEITADLNNLYFNVQVVQWNPANRLSAVGCRIAHVRPDIVSGEINIASENCPNFYSLKISDGPMPTSSATDMARSASVASFVRDGRITQVSSVYGEVQPSTNASTYRFSATRVSR